MGTVAASAASEHGGHQKEGHLGYLRRDTAAQENGNSSVWSPVQFIGGSTAYNSA